MDMFNAVDYGVKGDGLTDCTGALQAALEAAAHKGSTCFLPAGQYRMDGSVVVPPGVTLAGASGGVPHSRTPIGTVLLAYGGRGNSDGEPLITLSYNATVRNVTIHYPQQTFPNIVPYPWTIRGNGMLCQVTDVVLTNPYQALDFGTHTCELHTVRNVFGQPLKTGVYIDQCYDIGRLENVHFNPNFWTLMTLAPGLPDGQAQNLYKWLAQNLTGFKIGRTDWQYITNCFVIFPFIGFHFDDFGHGPGNTVITQSGADICPTAVRVDRTQSHAGVQITNGQFMSTLEVSDTNQGPVKLTNCGFWGVPETKAQVVKHGPSTLALTACHFTGWDAANQGASCIQADGGRLIVNGCDFMDTGKQDVLLEPGLVAATISGCLLRGENAVVNTSTADVQVGLNTTH